MGHIPRLNAKTNEGVDGTDSAVLDGMVEWLEKRGGKGEELSN